MTGPGAPLPSPADRLLPLLRAHGAAATSFQCLGPDLSAWFSPQGDAAVCYVATGGSWVAAGEPICAPSRLGEVAAEFARAAAAAGRRAILFAAEQRTVDALKEGPAAGLYTWVKIGEQPAFDPRGWTLEGRARRNLRAQVNRAANHGVSVREALPEELLEGGALRRGCARLLDAWLDSRTMSIMGFLVDLHPFEQPYERRYFVALVEGEPVALLAAAPIYARGGWFLEDLIRRPDAPNGAVEALIDRALTTFKAEGVSYATLGLAPLSGGPSEAPDRAPAGIRPWLPRIFELSYAHAGVLYSFQGLRAFKEKLRPDAWEPVYMAVSPPRVRPGVVWDMLSAFVPGSRVQFALDTAVRAVRAQCRRIPAGLWTATAWLLSLALIPWMALLLSVDARRYFEADWLPAAWVSFDAMMALLFALLATALDRWPRLAWSLSRVMLGATLADVWLTSAQVFLFNIPNAERGLDLFAAAVAVTAPALASLFLSLLVIKLRPGRD